MEDKAQLRSYWGDDSWETIWLMTMRLVGMGKCWGEEITIPRTKDRKEMKAQFLDTGEEQTRWYAWDWRGERVLDGAKSYFTPKATQSHWRILSMEQYDLIHVLNVHFFSYADNQLEGKRGQTN